MLKEEAEQTSERVWTPFARQEQFIQLPKSILEAFYGGAASGGKSELLVLLPLLYQFYQFRGFKGIILRRTFPELESEIILRAHSYYPETGAIYDSARKRYKWPAFNSYISFGHCQREQDIRAYDTSEFQFAGFDELTSFTEFQYSYLTFSRLRSTIPGLTPIARSASNPGNVGHSWVRKRFVAPAKEGGKILKDEKTGHMRIFIPAKVSDNPHVNPEYKAALEMLPESEKIAKLYGDWWTFSGQVFEDWRVEPFKDEPEEARHVVPDFDIPSWWPRLVSVDWGFSAATAIHYGAVSPEGRLYVYREHVKKEQLIAEIADYLLEQAYNEKYVDCVLDHTAFETRGETKSISMQLTELSGLTFRRADKGPGSRISGKVLIQELLRWRKRAIRVRNLEEYDHSKAQELLRVRGMEAYDAYIKGFKAPEEEQILPKVQIFESCEKLIDSIPVCVYAKDSDGNETEDVAEFKGDDAYDSFRYLCKAFQKYSGEAAKRSEAQQILADANRNLEKTGDMTTFYRQLEAYNKSGKATKTKSFRRIRSRVGATR